MVELARGRFYMLNGVKLAIEHKRVIEDELKIEGKPHILGAKT